MTNPFRKFIESENVMKSEIRFPFFLGLLRIAKSLTSWLFKSIKKYGVYLFIPRSWVYGLAFLFPLEACLIHEIRICGGIDSEKRNACYYIWNEFDIRTNLGLVLCLYGAFSHLALLLISVVCSIND